MWSLIGLVMTYVAELLWSYIDMIDGSDYLGMHLVTIAKVLSTHKVYTKLWSHTYIA